MNYITDIIADGRSQRFFVYSNSAKPCDIQIKYGGGEDIQLDDCLGVSTEALDGCLVMVCHTPDTVGFYEHISFEYSMDIVERPCFSGVDHTVIGAAVEKQHSAIAILTPGEVIYLSGKCGSVVARKSDYSVGICSLYGLLEKLGLLEYDTVCFYNDSYVTTVHLR